MPLAGLNQLDLVVGQQLIDLGPDGVSAPSGPRFFNQPDQFILSHPGTLGHTALDHQGQGSVIVLLFRLDPKETGLGQLQGSGFVFVGKLGREG